MLSQINNDNLKKIKIKTKNVSLEGQLLKNQLSAVLLFLICNRKNGFFFRN